MPQPLSRAEKQQKSSHITLIGMVLDIVLGIMKVVVGVVAHSHALVADGIHSFTDAGSDIMVLLIARFSHQEPDEDHPYGHGKFETLGTVLLGSTLIAVAGAMAHESVTRLLRGEATVVPEWPALVVALLSILGKEWIFRYTLKVGRLLNSDLLIANAWHSRSDALSSIVVLIALIGAMAGFPWLDAVAAVGVAILVGYIGWKLAWRSIRELVETAVDNEFIQELQQCATSVSGVRNVHYIRGRRLGPDIVVDLHVQVDPKISVSEGHHIGVQVAAALRKNFTHIADTTVHIDAEEDGELTEQLEVAKELPGREQVIATLLEAWRGILSEAAISKTLLHYLNDEIHIEVMLRKRWGNLDSEKEALERVADLEWLGGLVFWEPTSAMPTPEGVRSSLPGDLNLPADDVSPLRTHPD